MTTTMTIQNNEWARDEIVKGWLDEETQAVAEEAADTEIAYMILHVNKIVGSGWDYRDGKFTGPYLGGGVDPVARILHLMVAATDYTIEHLDEIRADNA